MHDTDAIRRDHPIGDVAAASGLELRPHGERLVAVCPFHGDSRPSLVIYPATQSYYCFGCGAGGDVIDFVSRLHRVDFREAVALLAGTQVPTMPAGAPHPPNVAAPEINPAKAAPIIETAVAFYKAAIRSRPKVLDYLAAAGSSHGRKKASWARIQRASSVAKPFLTSGAKCALMWSTSTRLRLDCSSGTGRSISPSRASSTANAGLKPSDARSFAGTALEHMTESGSPSAAGRSGWVSFPRRS